jgi:uncharacterized protein
MEVTVSGELSQLIELQELDLDIQRITDRLARIPVEREKIESEFQTQASEFLALQSTHEKHIADRKQLEIELAAAQQLHEKYKQDLMKVRNEKEYSTVLREIDATKKQVATYETEILRRLEEVEKLEKEIGDGAPDVERKRSEVDQFLVMLDSEVSDSNASLATLNRRREELVSLIPRAMLSTYDRMSRTKRGQALAAIRDGICSACRVRVRPKVFSDVRRGDQMITCESCGRILYYRPNTPQTAEASTN